MPLLQLRQRLKMCCYWPGETRGGNCAMSNQALQLQHGRHLTMMPFNMPQTQQQQPAGKSMGCVI
jgi:hypothetical protein